MAAIGGMGAEVQMTEQDSSLGFQMETKQQQPSQNQAGFSGSNFAPAIPITAQAGVIDGMEE